MIKRGLYRLVSPYSWYWGDTITKVGNRQFLNHIIEFDDKVGQFMLGTEEAHIEKDTLILPICWCDATWYLDKELNTWEKLKGYISTLPIWNRTVYYLWRHDILPDCIVYSQTGHILTKFVLPLPSAAI